MIPTAVTSPHIIITYAYELAGYSLLLTGHSQTAKCIIFTVTSINYAIFDLTTQSYQTYSSHVAIRSNIDNSDVH